MGDLGSNVDVFSRLAAQGGARVVSVDADPARVQLDLRETDEKACDVLPLWVDLCNPGPDVWMDEPGARLPCLPGPSARGDGSGPGSPPGAIGNNAPLPELAEYFALVGRDLIVEFVAREDPRVRTMLSSQKDIFSEYHRRGSRRHSVGTSRCKGLTPYPIPSTTFILCAGGTEREEMLPPPAVSPVDSAVSVLT